MDDEQGGAATGTPGDPVTEDDGGWAEAPGPGGTTDDGDDGPELTENAMRLADRVRRPEDLVRLSEFERRTYLPLVLSALLPIVVASSRAANDSGVAIAVNLVSWAVFVVDLVVHMRLVRRYLHTPLGILSLSVVIVTAPWFLFPAFDKSQLLMLFRLLRLVPLLMVSKGARRAARRLSDVGLFAGGMLFFCSWTAYVAEKPVNPEFSSFGKALWWGLVTITTVGYGDIVPITNKGRWAATFLMLTGVATLGLISGTLASLFRSSSSQAQGGMADVHEELVALREQLATVESHLANLTRESAARRDAPDEE